ncbi:choice-of-anchor D domain-containing protein [Flavobacterium hauense]
MFTKRFFLALALMVVSIGTTFQAAANVTLTEIRKTIECAGGGNETFANLGANSTAYSTRTWTGDNSVGWSASDSRTDQTLNGKALAMRTGTLTNTTTISGGVGTLSFNYKRVFTGNSTLKVFVNGTQYGGDITVSSDTSSVFSQAINVSGNVTIEIRNSGNRTTIDDLVWNCYDVPAVGPEIQIANGAGTNFNCGELTVDFGSQATGVSTDAVFTIKNTGTSALNVSSLALSNTTDFSIVSPSTSSFTVAASGSAIVLVRFNAASGGNKTSTLTVNSNDSNEAACVVNLKGAGLAPCVAPVVENGEIDLDNLTPFSINATVTVAGAESYLVVVSTVTPLGGLPADGASYNVGNAIGNGTVAYKGNLANISIGGLTENTPYYLFVFPYNSANCTGGPLYFTAESIDTFFSTPVAPCNGGNETFTNLGTNSSTYTNRTWVGDNGWQWNATDSRNDQTLNGKAITLRSGTLKNITPVNGGIGHLSFSYKRVFNDNSTLKLFVNGVQYGADITVSSETAATFSEDIDVEGPVTIELVNSGNRTVIDDLVWNCYSTPDRPELQLYDEEQNKKSCGDFDINYGTVQVGTNNDAIFTIKNEGLQDLVITAITLSDSTNFTVTNPSTPVTIPYLGTEDVTVRLNAAAVGEYATTLTIVSNDTTEGSCVVNLTSKAQNLCATPDVLTANAVVSNETATSLDVQVTGVTANGYVAFYTTAGTIDPASNGTVYTVGDVVGTATVGYVGTSATFTIENLSPSTTYAIAVYPYNNTECLGGPAYSAAAIETEGDTTIFTCTGGGETFSNIGASASSYATRSWTGDNGIDWTATDSRTDQTENGKAIAIRVGSVKNTEAILGGIGTLSFKYKRVFTNNSTLKVFVNGVQYGADIAVSSDIASTFTFAVNVSADATIELVNTGNRIIIDDITWTCYEGSGNRTAMKSKSEVVENSEVVVYPNPNNGQFQIDLATETADIMVYDASGKVIVKKSVSDNELIDMAGAQKGIYMVVITEGAKVSTKRVIIN